MNVNERELSQLNDEQFLDKFRFVTCCYFDFTRKSSEFSNFVEKFDNRIEYYDINGYLSMIFNSSNMAVNEMYCAAESLFNLAEEASEKFWALFNFMAKNKKELFLEEFKFNPDNINLKQLEEFIEENGIFVNFESALDKFTVPKKYNEIKNIINFAYNRITKDKYKYVEKPFLNDNFIVLKIMADNQAIIKGIKYVPLAQKDIADIADFGLNKVQGIMSMLIKWGYVETTDLKGRYIITESGNDMLEALMKIPITKFIE